MLSTEAIADRLRIAANAVDQAGLAEDLRVVGFERSLDAVGLSGPSRDGSSTDEAAAADPEDPIGRIATKLSLGRDAVSRIYEQQDGQVRLIVTRAMLPAPDSKAASMRHVSLLAVVGRQAAGVEDFTSYVSLREECAELRVLDAPNFATEVAKLDFRTQGGPRRREARANRHHFEEAAGLIRQITGGGQP